MGCDIHLHIEVKIEGIWHHYAAPSINRNYYLFEKMAGVRGDVNNAISPPKGFPNNATELTNIVYQNEECGSHSVSWLGIDEIMKLEDWLKSISTKETDGYAKYDLEYDILRTYLGGDSFTGWKRDPEVGSPLSPAMVEDVRFIFWFDN